LPDVGIHRKGEVDFPSLLEKFRRELGGSVGAIGCFIGVVRGISKEGEKIKSLRYEHSDEAVGKLEEIASDVERSPDISRVLIHHVIDELKPGEDAIYVLVAGKRRDEVFKALPKIMDRIKVEVPIWKKEVTETKEYWINEVG
jgi:molybdopterin synthase catalytic subunit